MRIIRLLLISVVLAVVTGCSADRFSEVHPQQAFVAAMNILEPSLQFFDKDGQLIGQWEFEKAYSGALLMGHDQVVLYGHQLNEAVFYELSTGKLLTTIKTGIGTTNAYFDAEHEKLFLTNSKTNELMRFSASGKLEQSVKLGNYPMSMMAVGDKLYVVNYKDTMLSVVAMDTMEIIDEWKVAQSANGLLYIPKQQTIWIGGHGEGMSPNESVAVYDVSSGEQISKVSMPLMPVAFSAAEKEIATVSHGTNMLYVTNDVGVHKWSLEIAANPFAVAHFADSIVVAGYDDQTLYFVRDREIVKKVQTNKGPFQLIVREASEDGINTTSR